MLVQILAVFCRVITLPVIGPKPTNFGSVFEIVVALGGRNGIEIGMRHGGGRLRVDGSAPGGIVGGPGGQEGMEVAAFFGGEAACFIRCCPEPVQSQLEYQPLGRRLPASSCFDRRK
jgi:hypothetical protein